MNLLPLPNPRRRISGAFSIEMDQRKALSGRASFIFFRWWGSAILAPLLIFVIFNELFSGSAN